MPDPLRIYTTETCPWCHVAMDWMDEHGIAYRVVDVTSDETLQQELLTLTNQRRVPVIAAGDRFVIGFKPEEISELAGEPPV